MPARGSRGSSRTSPASACRPATRTATATTTRAKTRTLTPLPLPLTPSPPPAAARPGPGQQRLHRGERILAHGVAHRGVREAGNLEQLRQAGQRDPAGCGVGGVARRRRPGRRLGRRLGQPRKLPGEELQLGLRGTAAQLARPRPPATAA